MSEEINNEIDQNVTKKGPGDRLQAARIEQGITIEDIARQMNLNVQIIKSIEADDYADLQSPIFMRGYLRTYARLVGINEDETIKIFGEFYQQDDPDIRTIGNTSPEISSNDIRVKWMTYIVIIGLLGLLSVWWVNNYRISETSETVTETSGSSISQDSIENSEIVIESTENKVVINTADNDNIKSLEFEEVTTVGSKIDIASIDEPIEQDSNETVSEVSAPLESNVQDEVVVQEVTNNDVELSTQVEEPIETIVLPKQYTKEVNASQGSDVLEITVIAASWGNIKDFNKFNLIQDLMNNGETYRFVGQAPFNVFLGNGYGVELKLNGESFDFTNFIKSSNNTARFEVGS